MRAAVVIYLPIPLPASDTRFVLSVRDRVHAGAPETTMTPSREARIEDFVDISFLQRLQDSFAEAMGVAAVTVDREGKPVTATSNFCSVCQMIRETEAGLARCQRCDAEGGRIALKRQEPFAYKCAGGFLDAAAPIIIDGQYLGCILCGQVIPPEDYDAYVQDILARNIPLGIDPIRLEAAVRGISPLPRDRFEAAVEMLSLTANHVIEKGAAHLTQEQLLRESQERAALQAALQEAQLRALKAQINPHFLFNSLSLLGYTALSGDSGRTEEIVFSLSDLLRYSLRNTSSSVELGEEIDMIRKYLAIQTIGFGDRLRSEIAVEPGLERVQIPCMLLQPLVENAVLHGAEPMIRPVTVAVRAYERQGTLVLEVADDGAGMPPELVQAIASNAFDYSPRRSIGIQNVFQRLQGEYGENCAFEVESTLNHGATFRISIRMAEDGRLLPPPGEDARRFTGRASGLSANRAVAGLEGLGRLDVRDESLFDTILTPLR